MSNIAVVQRPAFFKWANGRTEVVQVNLQCDPAKEDPRYSGVPTWQLTVGYQGKRFQFEKDAKSARRAHITRPIYKELEPEEDIVLTPEQEFQQMEDFAHMQQVQMQADATTIREQSSTIAGLRGLVTGMQSRIDKLEK